MLRRRILNLGYIISIILVSISCYERQEGCLDIAAENYDFTADDPCEDCCTYPTMSISVSHEWGDTLLFTDSLYQNDAEELIKILDVKFYLAQFELLLGEEGVGIEEELEVVSPSGESSLVSDNFTFVQESRFNYSIGTFNDPQTFEGASFYLGIPGNYIASDSLETFVEDASFFDEEAFVHTNFYMQYVVDTMSNDTLELFLNGTEFSERLSIQFNYEVPLGQDFSIPLVINYQELLRESEFSNLQSTSEKEGMKSRYDQIFSVR